MEDRLLKYRDVIKSEPRLYQGDVLVEHAEDPFFMLFWQQGVGKTKPCIDTAAWLFKQNKIDALLILAPNGVHYNWVDHELPKHCGVPYKAHGFDNPKDSSGNKAHARAMAELLEHDPGRLTVLTVGFPALLKPTMIDLVTKGHKRGEISGRLADFVKSRRVMVVGDEIGMMKNPEGQQALRAQALARHCKYRWGLDGTPVDNSPFDLYAIMKFGDHRFWEKNGIGSYTSFQKRYGIFEAINVTLYTKDKDGNTQVRKRYNPSTREMEPARPQHVVGYKNLDDLRRIIQPYSSRITKKQAGLDIPDKSYVYHPFDLTPKQREVYEKIKKEYMVVIGDNLITAPLAMVRLLRLSQITSGYIPTDDPTIEPQLEIDPGKNPRLDALVGLVEPMTVQGLIWASFIPERDKIIDALGSKVACYMGSDDQKREAIESWRRGDVQFLLGNVLSGLARGHTLTEGTVGIYYSNRYRHGPRMQSEDRMHRQGQKNIVTYYDLSARNTVDQDITEALKSKVAVAAETLGDDPIEWLS